MKKTDKFISFVVLRCTSPSCVIFLSTEMVQAFFYRAADFECTLPQVVHLKVFSMFLPSLRMRSFVGFTRKTTPQAAHQNIV